MKFFTLTLVVCLFAFGTCQDPNIEAGEGGAATTLPADINEKNDEKNVPENAPTGGNDSGNNEGVDWNQMVMGQSGYLVPRYPKATATTAPPMCAKNFQLTVKEQGEKFEPFNVGTEGLQLALCLDIPNFVLHVIQVVNETHNEWIGMIVSCTNEDVMLPPADRMGDTRLVSGTYLLEGLRLNATGEPAADGPFAEPVIVPFKGHCTSCGDSPFDRSGICAVCGDDLFAPEFEQCDIAPGVAEYCVNEEGTGPCVVSRFNQTCYDAMKWYFVNQSLEFDEIAQNSITGYVECVGCQTINYDSCHACGDLEKGPEEECDATDFHDEEGIQATTCNDIEGFHGTDAPSCMKNCKIDTSVCGRCGDEKFDPEYEKCDWSAPDYKPMLCHEYDNKFPSDSDAEATCDKTCGWDTSACSACGTGIMTSDKDCDKGVDFEKSCAKYDPRIYKGGNLSCNLVGCKFDLTGCDKKPCECVDGTAEIACSAIANHTYTGGKAKCVDCLYEVSKCTGTAAVMEPTPFMEWWIWLCIGLAVLLVVAILGAGCYIHKKRANTGTQTAQY